MTERPSTSDAAPTRVTTPREGVAFAGWDDTAPIDAPLRLHDATVIQAWCDYNGHMSESSYLLVVGDNADAFFRYFGIDEAYRASGGSLVHRRNASAPPTRSRRGRPSQFHPSGAGC